MTQALNYANSLGTQSAHRYNFDYKKNDTVIKKFLEQNENKGLYFAEPEKTDIIDLYVFATAEDRDNGTNIIAGLEFEQLKDTTWTKTNLPKWRYYLERKRKQLKYPYITFYVQFNFDLTQATVLPHSYIYSQPAVLRDVVGLDIMYVVDTEKEFKGKTNPNKLADQIIYEIGRLTNTNKQALLQDTNLFKEKARELNQIYKLQHADQTIFRTCMYQLLEDKYKDEYAQTIKEIKELEQALLTTSVANSSLHVVYEQAIATKKSKISYMNPDKLTKACYYQNLTENQKYLELYESLIKSNNQNLRIEYNGNRENIGDSLEKATYHWEKNLKENLLTDKIVEQANPEDIDQAEAQALKDLEATYIQLQEQIKEQYRQAREELEDENLRKQRVDNRMSLVRETLNLDELGLLIK